MADELFQLPETPTTAIAPENQTQNGGFQGLEKNQISTNPLGTKAPPTFGDVLSFVNAKYAKENPYKQSESLFMPLAKTPLSDIPYTVDPEIGYSAFSSDKERTDAYSAKQSAIGNIGRNLIGFASNAISTALGDFDYAQEYNINGAGFDKNSFKNTLIDWAEKVQKDNYVQPTSYIEEHPWLSFVNPLELRSLTDRWGGILPSLGFTAGSIANAIATDMAIASVTGVGEIGLLPAQASKIIKGLFNGFKEKKALSAIAETAQAVKTLSTTNKVGNAMRQGFALYNSALGEATMEGYTNFKDTKSKMIEDYKATYGLDPTPEDLKSMDDTARSAGTASVYANTALLMATNFLEFGSIFKPTAALTREATNAMTEGKIIVRSLDEAAVRAEKKLTLLERTSKSLTNAVKKSESIPRIMLTEGFEEGAQFTISQKEKDYWSRKYNNTDEADQNWKSWMYGINQTFSTREGMENIVMGALAGPSIHGVSNLYKGLKARMSGVSLKDQRAHALASTVNVINSVGISGMFGDGYDGLVTSQENAKGMKESLKNNDLGSFKNFKMDQLFNKVHTALKTNHFDIVGEQLDMASNLTGSNFETISGMQDTQENRATFKQYVEKVKQKTNDMKATINDVEGAFGTNPFNPKNDNISYKAFNNYKEALAHTLVTVKDSSQRYEQLISEVKRISPNTNTDKIERMLSPKGIKETHAEVKARIKELEDAETNSASNPELQKQFTNEKNTLLEHVDNLDKLANNKEVGSNTYKDTFDGMLNYYSKSAKDNKFDSVSNTDKVFTRLFDAQRLVDRAKTAKDLYKTLTKKEGFNTFKEQVQDIIENKFESRLRWDENNNLTILSAKQLEEEKAKKKAEGVKGLEEIKNELIQQKAIQTVEEGFSEEELNKIIELKQKELSSTKELTQDEIDAIEKERADIKEQAKNGVYDDRFKGNTYEEHVANIDKYFDDKLKNKNSLTDEEKEILFNYRDKIDQEAMRLNGEFEKDIDLEKLVEELGPDVVEQMIRARHNEPSFTKDVDISSISNLFGTMPYFLHTPELVNLFNQVKNGNPQLYGAFIQKTNLFDFLFNQAEAKLVNESNVENLVKSVTSKNKKDFIKARIENMFQSAFGKNGSKVYWMTSEELQAKIDSTKNAKYNFLGEKGAARLQNMVSNNLMNKLIEAKQMEKDGINPIDIYEKTGWQKNKNNEWRTETNYKLNFLNNFNSFKNNFPRDNVMQLDNIIDYPQLFAAYPELKKLKLVYLDQKYYEDDETIAAYSNTTISPGILKSNSHLKGTKHIIVLHSIPETQDGLKRILLHELQHAIQFIENKKETFNAPEDSRLTDLNNKLAELEKIATLTKKQLKEYSNLSKQKEDLLYELYFNNPVEVEARNVENRSLLSEEERKQLPISTTEFIELNQKYNFVGENAILPETIRTSLSTARILEKAYKLPDNYWELYPMRSQDLKTDKHDEVYDKVMQIYTGTGWQRGVDGLWRYDMGVQDYIFLPSIEGNEFYEKKNYSTTLDKVIESKSLYEAYPELAKINIVLAPGEKSIKRIYKNGEFKDEEYTSSGLWNPSTNTITIDSTVDAYEQYNILLHELQHAIQDKEGFATGSSTEEAEERLLTDNEKLLGTGKKYKDILKTYNENILMYGKDNKQNKKIDAEIEKLKEAIKKKFKVNSWDDLVTAVYEGSVGEVDARNVSYRKNLSEEERRQYLLSETEDVALEQKSILFKTFRPVASVTQKLSKDEISKKLNEKFNPDYKNTIVEKLAKFDEQIKNKKFPSALEVAEHVLPRNIFNRYKNLYELAAKNNITVSNERLPSGTTASWAFNSIQLNKDIAKYYINDYEEFAETLNHEIIHGLLSRGIKNNYNLFNDLQNIMTQVLNKFDSASEEVKTIISYIEDIRNEFKEKDFLNSTNKEIGNLEELLTYAFTNKEFADFLDSIPASKNIKAEGNSIFQQLKNIIRNYIKSITNESTALDEINSILDKYFDTTFNEKDIAKRNKEYNWGLTFKANENIFDKYNNDPKIIMDAYNLNKDSKLVKAVEDIMEIPKSKQQLSEEKNSGVGFGTAFDVQDETAENTVSAKSLWGEAQVWRERIENAGDILRELSSRGDKPDVKYLMEKVKKLRDWITKNKEGYTPIDKSIKTIEEFKKTKLIFSDAIDSREYIEKFHSSILDKIKSEYEAIPTYTKEQRLAVDLVLDLINNNIKGLESKLNEIENISNQIKTNGTLPIVADINLGKSNIEDSDFEIIYSTNKSGILGFTSGDDIFLNSDALIGKSNNDVDGNTPIHEAGHLWLKWAKANNTALYEKGMSLVEGSSYLKKVMSDPFYKEEAKRFKTKKERDDFFKDEALARAIGDRGGEFLQESTKRDFKQWLTNLFNSVMDFLGIRNLTEEEIDKLTFDQFTKMVAADVISGQNINDKTNIRNNSVERGVQYGIKIENDDTADEEKFTRISNQLFRGQSKTKAFLEAGGKRITQITGVNTIFAKIENDYVPLMEAFNKNLITSKNFKNITGVDLKNMPDYLANLKAYSDLADSLFKSNKTDFTDEEVRNLINVRPLLGGRDQVNRADKATTLEDLKALGKNSYILSFTNTYDKKGRKLDTKIYVIDKNGGSLLNPNHEIYKLVMDNMDMLEKNSKRYVLVNRQPSGNFANTSFIFGRAKQVSRSVTDSLVSAISENDMEETKKILDTLFISDKSGQFKGKIDMMAALDEIRPSDRQRITSLEFLAKALNQTSYMQDREIEIETDSFNYHIPKDEEAKFSDFNKTLTLAVKPNIYSNINLVIYPKGLNESIKNKEEVKTEEAPAEEVVTKKTKTKKSKAKQNTVSLTYENETLDIDNDIDSKVAEEIVKKYEDILQKLQDNKTITKEPCA